MTKPFRAATILFFLSLFLNGCIQVEQKTTINEDLSGTIKLHYYTATSNVATGGAGGMQMGDDIAGYSFVDEEIKKKYNSPVTEIKEMKRFVDNKDSTTHIDLLISFKDFNKLSEALGFEKVKASYVKGDGGMEFKYLIPKDTAIKKQYIQGQPEKLEYIFEFPAEVKESNGVMEGKTAKWEKSVTQLADGDLEMTALIKGKFNICGLFGIELPLILFAGMIFIFRNRKKIVK